jgi:thiol-disulfide isomerase/thioredoxin
VKLIKPASFSLTFYPHLIRCLKMGRGVFSRNWNAKDIQPPPFLRCYRNLSIMMRKLLPLAIYGLLGLTILAGCKASETRDSLPQPTLTQSGPTITPEATLLPTTMVVTSYPEPAIPAGTIYPAPAEAVATIYPLPPTPYQAVYPGLTGTLSAYPEPGVQDPTPYPAPTDPAQAAYPDPTQPGEAYPGPTQPSTPVNAAPATATLPVTLSTSTPTGSPVPTNTLLPTATPGPTVTPTPELPPPIRTELAASNPDLFQLDSGDVQLVEFFAYWCVTCRSMAPTIHSLEALYGNRMNFIYLDIDDPANFEHQRRLGYRYQPHFFLLDEEGKILRQWIGWILVDDLRNAIDAALR